MHQKRTSLWGLSVCSISEYSLWKCLPVAFLNAPIDLHRTKVLVSWFAMPILHWINVLSKVLKSKTVYYFIMWKKYTHLNLMLCVALWFMSHTKNHSSCVSQIQTEISNDYMKWSNIICCILPIINIYHIPSHLINSLRHNGELNYSKIITALQIIPYSRKQYFIPCTKAI